MSQENVDTVKELLTLYAAGDRESWRRYMAEDVVWDMTRSALLQAGIYRGHDGIVRFFTDWLGTWEDYEVEVRELVDAGDSVVAVLHQRGRGRTSGVITERDFAGVYDVRDGVVTRYREFEGREAALQAARVAGER